MEQKTAPSLSDFILGAKKNQGAKVLEPPHDKTTEELREKLREDLKRVNLEETQDKIDELTNAQLQQRIDDIKAGRHPGTTGAGVAGTKSESSVAVNKEFMEMLAALPPDIDSDTKSKVILGFFQRSAGSVGITGGSMGAGDIPALITAIANAVSGNNKGSDPELKALLQKLTDNNTTQQNEQLKTLVTSVQTMAEEIKKIKLGEGSGGDTKKRGKVIVIDQDKKIHEYEDGQPIIVEHNAATEKPLEMIHEENRHAEEMAKVNEQEKFHKDIVGTAQDAMVNIGEGLARNAERQAADGEGEGAVVKKAKGESIKCPDCQNEIPIFPETASPVECPNCGQTLYWKKDVK